MKEPKLVVYVQIDGRYLEGIADSSDITTKELLKIVKREFEQRLKNDFPEIPGVKTAEIKVEYELDFPTAICIDFGMVTDSQKLHYIEDIRAEDSVLTETFGVKKPIKFGWEVAELFLRSLICLGTDIPKRYMSRVTIAR